jgi:hypothetical protein
MAKTANYFRKTQKIWWLIEYKPRWGLTIQGWLLILLLTSTAILLIGSKLQHFLAYSAPVKAEVLVVEGWIDDEGLLGASAEFQQKNYQFLITTGTPLTRGAYLSEYKSFAQLSAATLISLGFDGDKLIIIPTPAVKKDRTLAGAIAVKQWLENNNVKITGMNIYSDDVHTRRTWLLFRKAIPPNIQVGAIAHPSIRYDAKSWWTSSEGVRKVLSELLAYCYVKFFNWQA